MTIKTVCMDCEELIVDGPLSEEGLISHGLCSRCKEVRIQELYPPKLKRGDAIQYRTSYFDDHPVPLGTVIFGKVISRSKSSIDVHWSIIDEDEYGIPEELLERVERR